ncbi:hypothetical protein CUMW_048540 [Citrus unshiu]|nr:hypothetical protein CUMW_048540 [Citrus unshiu]
MAKDSDSSSMVRLNIGQGKKFIQQLYSIRRCVLSLCLQLFQRSPYCVQDSGGKSTSLGYIIQILIFEHIELLQGYIFVDRDGKHFRHILNWLRDGAVPTLTESKFLELLREAEYYQLLDGIWGTAKGLIERIHTVTNKRKEDNELDTELTRIDIIKCIQSEKVRFRGLNLSGLDLSKLVIITELRCLKDFYSMNTSSFMSAIIWFSEEIVEFANLCICFASFQKSSEDLSLVDFSYACLRNVFFSRANLQSAKFRDVDAEGSIFHNATLRECEFAGANLRGALLAGANLQSANLQGNSHTGISYLN